MASDLMTEPVLDTKATAGADSITIKVRRSGKTKTMKLASRAKAKVSAQNGTVVVSNRASARAQRAFAGSKGPLRVLVVEDAGKVRDAASDVLARRGMIVHKTAKPDSLLQAVMRFRPDVVVMDDYFSKAQVSSASLMPQIMERFPGVRFVVTSDKPLSTLTPATDPHRWGASRVVEKATMLRDNNLERSVITATWD